MADGESGRLLLEFEVRLDKLNQQLGKANKLIQGSAEQAEKHLAKVDNRFSHMFGSFEPGKALDNVFSRSRFALIEEGGARIGVFGKALEDLGPIGIAAGAGLAAVALGFEQAIKVTEYAETLQRTAKSIGISTTALQEFDFVATASGISTDTFRESVQKLNEKIGQVQSGVAKAQLVNVFKALGFTPESLRTAGGVENVLKGIADKLASLPAAERAGLAARLDLAPILPALLKGRDGLSDLIAEAHRYGIIIDADVIKKSAAAAEQLHIASDVIDKELKVAFANLAPVVAGVATSFASATQHLAAFLGEVGDALQPLSALIDKLHQIPGFDQAGAALKKVDSLIIDAELGQPGHEFDELARIGRQNKLKAGVAALAAGGGPSEEFKAEYLDVHGDGSKPAALIDPKAKAGPHDATDSLTKAADEALDHAKKDLAEAYKALTNDIDARAAFEIQANDAEAKARTDAIDGQIKALLKDKTIDGAKSDQLQAELETARTDVELTRAAKEQLILREADLKRDQEQLALNKEIDGYLEQAEAIEAKLAGTRQQRFEIESRSLRQRQRLESEQLQLENTARVTAATPAGPEAVARVTRENQDRTDAQEREQDARAAQLLRDQAYLVEDRALEVKQAIVEAGLAELQAQADTAKTAGERSAIERRILEIRQQLERDLEGARIDRRVAEGDLTPGEGNTERAAQAQKQAADTKIFDAQQLQPLRDGIKGALEAGVHGGWPGLVAYMAQTLETKLIDALTNSLVDGLLSGGKGGGLLGGLFSALFSVPGFADGTDYAPGGLAIVGERGRELVNLPRGSQVIPNHELTKSIGRIDAGSLRASPSVFSPHYHLEGALVAQDLIDQMNTIGQVHGERAYRRAVSTSKGGLPSNLRTRKLLVD